MTGAHTTRRPTARTSRTYPLVPAQFSPLVPPSKLIKRYTSHGAGSGPGLSSRLSTSPGVSAKSCPLGMDSRRHPPPSRRARDVFGPQRLDRSHLAACCLPNAVANMRDEFCVHSAGLDHTHAHPLRLEFLAQRFSKPGESELGHGVDAASRPGHASCG